MAEQPKPYSMRVSAKHFTSFPKVNFAGLVINFYGDFKENPNFLLRFMIINYIFLDILG